MNKLGLILLSFFIPALSYGQSLLTLNKKLYHAVEKKSAQEVKQLLDKGADPNFQHSFNYTPLMGASYSGSADIVKLLLEAGADPKLKSQIEWTALHWAGEQKEIKIMEMLLDYGADPNAQDDFGKSFLMKASARGQTDIASLLLDKGANPNLQDYFSWTPLRIASDRGELNMVKLLLDKGADVESKNEFGWTALKDASWRGHVKIVEELLKRGADVNANNGSFALMLAAEKGHTDTVKLLLKHGAKVNIKNDSGETALQIASKNGHKKTVKILEEAVKQLHLNFELIDASIKKELVEVSSALDRGADIEARSENGRTPLMIAGGVHGSADIVKLLLKRGAKPKAKDQRGWTALNHAQFYKNKDIVSLLEKAMEKLNRELFEASARADFKAVKSALDKGADPKAINQGFQTPLILALVHYPTHQKADVIELLLERGADVNAQDILGNSPLMFASVKENLDIPKLLLKKGADPNLSNKKGWSPLMSASKAGHVPVVKLLLETGADPRAQSETGWTASELSNNNDILKLLEKAIKKQACQKAFKN